MTASSGSQARAPKGAMTLMVAQLIRAAALFLGLFFLSRLLEPADFGFVAVPAAVVGVGEMIRDLGISTATTTAREVSRDTRDALLWVNVSLGVTLAFLLSAGGAVFGIILDQPSYIAVCFSLSFVFIINGWGAQYRAGLVRNMRFRALALADSSGAVVGIGAAIGVAVAGGGYWAVVIQQLALALVTVGVLVGMGRWRPRKPRRSREAGTILRFGLRVSWSQVLNYLGNNADTFALALTVPATQLGYYTRSFQLSFQPLGIMKAPMTSVALPLLARRRDDRSGYERAVLLAQTLIAYTILPPAVLFSVCAAPVVALFLGPQWLSAVPIITLLALAGGVQQLISVSGWMLLSRNLGRTLTRSTSVTVAVKVVLVIATAPFGPVPVAAAYLGAMIVTGPVALAWACRASEVRVTQVIRRMLTPVTLAATSGAIAFAVLNALAPTISPILQLTLGTSIFAMIYGGAALVPTIRRDYRDILGLVKPSRH